MTANPQPTITIPELTPFLRVNQFPMSPQSLLPVQIQEFPPRLPPNPASLLWPPALLSATRRRPAPKAVMNQVNQMERNVLNLTITGTLATKTVKMITLIFQFIHQVQQITGLLSA